MPSWYLANADELAAEYKYTFYKPPASLLERVTSGEVVKLIFRFESEDPEAPAAERMWVLVDEVFGNGCFRGRLDNQPRHIRDLKPGDLLEFNACNVINTEHDDGTSVVEKYIKRCFVTNRVLRDGAPVGYLYREDPDAGDDSGWRFTANDETDEYMQNSENSAYVSLGAVLNQDDSFLHLLDAPAGSAFVRDPHSREFVACQDEA